MSSYQLFWKHYLLSLMLSVMAYHSAYAHEGKQPLKVYGVIENVTISPEGLTIPAKLDTGAVTASLDAINIEEFTRDGNTWVRFDVPIPDTKEVLTLERPLERYAYIKRRASATGQIPPPAQRPVVILELCLGGTQHAVEVNLTNRQHFNYQLLVGSQAIAQFGAAINPAQEYTQPTAAECAELNA